MLNPCLVAAARLLWFNGYLHKFMTVELRHVCMHNRNPRKNVAEKKGNLLINAANIATSYFICHFYCQHASVISVTVHCI